MFFKNLTEPRAAQKHNTYSQEKKIEGGPKRGGGGKALTPPVHTEGPLGGAKKLNNGSNVVENQKVFTSARTPLKRAQMSHKSAVSWRGEKHGW